MFEVDDPRFRDQHAAPASLPDEQPPEPPEPKKGPGCFFWGCLITAILMLLLFVGVPLALYFTARHYVHKFTAPEPAAIEVVDLPEERLAAIQARVDAFKRAVDEDEQPEVLELTAEEINGLIQQNEELQGKVFVRIRDGGVGGDVSIPLDKLPIPGGGGRYFNATVEFDIAMVDDELDVRLADGAVNGAPIPEKVLEALASENLAAELQKDPKARKQIAKFESLEVAGDKIILRPRAPDANPANGEADDPDSAEELFEPLGTE